MQFVERATGIAPRRPELGQDALDLRPFGEQPGARGDEVVEHVGRQRRAHRQRAADGLDLVRLHAGIIPNVSSYQQAAPIPTSGHATARSVTSDR